MTAVAAAKAAARFLDQSAQVLAEHDATSLDRTVAQLADGTLPLAAADKARCGGLRCGCSNLNEARYEDRLLLPFVATDGTMGMDDGYAARCNADRYPDLYGDWCYRPPGGAQ